MTETTKTSTVPAPHANLLWVAVVLGVVTTLIYILRDADRDPKAWYAAGVLLMPVVLLCLCTALESKLVSLVIVFAEMVRIVAVIIFCQVTPSSPSWLPRLLLALALFVMVITVLLARSITAPFGWPRSLANSQQVYPGSKLLAWAVFVLFLQIATLLGLALGVHDKASGGASIAETRPAEDYLRAASADDAMASLPAKVVYRPRCPNDAACIPADALADLFRQPDIVAAFDQQAAISKPMLETVKTRLVEYIRIRSNSSAPITVAPFSDEAIATAAQNLLHLRLLRHRMEAECGRIEEEKPPCVVAILGHATDAVGKDGPAGNARLAALRAADTHHLVRRLTDDRNIIWFVRSVSNRDEHLDKTGQGFDQNVNHKLASEVWVEHGNRLGLLDYLYFMVYTITTTGYGDLVPVSGFAQLVATIANIYEVFFVVILVNILMVARSATDQKINDTASTVSEATPTASTSTKTPEG